MSRCPFFYFGVMMSDPHTFELEITAGDASGITVDEDDLKKNTMHKEAKGGTELMLAGLKERLDPKLWNKFNSCISCFLPWFSRIIRHYNVLSITCFTHF